MSQALVGGPKRVGAPLRRHSSDRWLGGVAGGIARYVGTDPILIRAAIILLTVMGGAGFPIYIAAALLMPADGETSSVAERLLKNRHGEWSKPAVVVAALLGITIFGANSDGFIGSLFPLLLVGGGVYLLANRSGGQTRSVDAPAPQAWAPPTNTFPTTTTATSETIPTNVNPGPPVTATPPPPPSPTVSEPGGVASSLPPPPPLVPPADHDDEDPILAAARELDAEIYDPSPSWQPYSYQPEEPVPFVPKRRRNPLVGIALSTLVIVGGLAIVASAASLFTIPVSAFAAFGLVVVGGALVLSRPLGGARLLIPVGVILALMAVIPNVAGTDDYGGAAGDYNVAPATLIGPITEYRYGAGEVFIDLSAVEIEGEQQQVTAFLGAGEMRIEVPDDLRVVAKAGAGAGDVVLFGTQSEGVAPGDQITLNEGAEGGTLVVDASVGLGELTLIQVPRSPVPLGEPSRSFDGDELDEERDRISAERDRLEAELDAEKDRFDAERDRLEAELDAERERIEAERDRLEDERNSLQEDGS